MTRLRTLVLLTLLLSGRAMTLAFVSRAGGNHPGDPPGAWLMPLIGDAVVGLLALPLAYFLGTSQRYGVWLAAVAWNALAIWDALSAYVVHLTVPWPEFFMIRTFGASMFFAASAMHITCLVILFRPQVRDHFQVPCRMPSMGTPA